jgi:hypothetical protein
MHYSSFFSSLLAGNIFCTAVFINWLRIHSDRYWLHNCGLHFPPLFPACSKWSVIGYSGNCLANFKVIEYTKAITQLLSQCQMNVTLQYSFSLSWLYILQVQYGE